MHAELHENHKQVNKTMSYKSRLRLSITADVLFLITLQIAAVLYVNNKIEYDTLWLCSTGAAVILLFAWGIKDYGKYHKWQGIWKDSVPMKAIYVTLSVVILFYYFENLQMERMSVAMMILVIILQTIRDVKYYNRAVKYDMDNLEDVNELARRFPEARLYINRKEKENL